MVAREREREFRGFNKLEKDNLKVYEKGIQTRHNRAGAIREINSIKPMRFPKKLQDNQLGVSSFDESREQGNK